LNLWLVIR